MLSAGNIVQITISSEARSSALCRNAQVREITFSTKAELHKS